MSFDFCGLLTCKYKKDLKAERHLSSLWENSARRCATEIDSMLGSLSPLFRKNILLEESIEKEHLEHLKTKQELSKIKEDIELAAQELGVKIPVAGTDAAKLLHANVMMRKYRIPELQEKLTSAYEYIKDLKQDVEYLESINYSLNESMSSFQPSGALNRDGTRNDPGPPGSNTKRKPDL